MCVHTRSWWYLFVINNMHCLRVYQFAKKKIKALKDRIGYIYNWSWVPWEPGLPTTAYQAKPVQDIWYQTGCMQICLPCFPVFALSWYNLSHVHHDSGSPHIMRDVKGVKTTWDRPRPRLPPPLPSTTHTSPNLP